MYHFTDDTRQKTGTIWLFISLLADNAFMLVVFVEN